MGPCSLVSLASRLAEDQLWCQLGRQMLTCLLGKRYCEWKWCMCSLQSRSIGLDLAFFMLCTVRRTGLEVELFRTQHRQSYIMHRLLIWTFFHHNFTRLLIGKLGEKRMNSCPAEMFLAFYSPPNIPRLARSFDVFYKSEINVLSKDSP